MTGFEPRPETVQKAAHGRCGYTVVDGDGIEQPCDRPASGWRWYQDCEHEDALAVACDWHANEGGRRICAAEARVAEVEAERDNWKSLYMFAIEEGQAAIGARNEKCVAAEARAVKAERAVARAVNIVALYSGSNGYASMAAVARDFGNALAEPVTDTTEDGDT